MIRKKLSLQLPDWLVEKLKNSQRIFASHPLIEDQAQMAFVIELSRMNIQYQTGGPFAAAIFSDSGRLIAAGVNLVTSANCSVLHAEMVAMMWAQSQEKNFDLSQIKDAPCRLVSSTEPCAMCYGAVPWSGVQTLLCGARDEDARAIGFDEGPKREDWRKQLELRGIRVMPDVLRDQAVNVLREYNNCGGLIYNSGTRE